MIEFTWQNLLVVLVCWFWIGFVVGVLLGRRLRRLDGSIS